MSAALSAPYAALNAFIIWRYSRDENIDAILSETQVFEDALSFTILILLLVNVFIWCRLYYRAARNLHLIDAAGMVTTPFWSVGTYFIPIVSLWKPLGAMRQIWRGSFDPAEASVEPPATIGWWWGTWIISGLLENISFRLLIGSGYFQEQIKDPDRYLGSLALEVLAMPFSLAATLLAISVTKSIVAAQRQNVLVLTFDRGRPD